MTEIFHPSLVNVFFNVFIGQINFIYLFPKHNKTLHSGKRPSLNLHKSIKISKIVFQINHLSMFEKLNKMALRYAYIISITILLLLEPVFTKPSFHRVQMFGNTSLGYYFIDMYVGNPQQKQSFLLDTGSYLSTLTCSQCMICDQFKNTKIFNTERSFTNKKVKCSSRASICSKDRCENKNQYCQYKNFYADGTNNIGTIVEDEFGFVDDDKDVFKAYFGCKKYEQENTKLNTAGLLGLAPVPSDNILYYWFNMENGRQNQFSVCIGEKDGYFQIGREPATQANPISFSFNNNNNFYQIQSISSIKYGKRNILTKILKNVILDTGSTFSYFPPQQIFKIYTVIQQICSKSKGCSTNSMHASKGCFFYNVSIGEAEIWNQIKNIFPILSIEIQGETFDWPPQNQFIMISLDQYVDIKAFCHGTKTKPNLPLSILGSNWMKNKKITFNLNQQKIYVIQNQQCKYTPYLSNNQNSIYYKKIKVAVDWTKAFIQKYWIVLVTVFILIVILLRNKIDYLMNLLRNFIRGSTQVKKNQLQEEVSVQSQSQVNNQTVNTTSENQREVIQEQ